MLPDYFEIQKELQTTCREIDGHLKVMDQMIQQIGTKYDTPKARQDFARVRKSVSVKLSRVSLLIRTHSDAIDEHTHIEYQRLTAKSRTNNDKARALHKKFKPYRGGIPSQTEKEPLIKRGSSSYAGYDSTSSLSHQSSSRRQRKSKQKTSEMMLSYQPYSQLESQQTSQTQTQSQSQTTQSQTTSSHHIMDPQWMANVRIIDAGSILEEREEKMYNIKEQMSEIKESFVTLHDAVDSQQLKVDTLANTIQTIGDDTAAGNEQLIKGEAKMAKKRRIKCYLFIFLLLVIAVLISIIWWYETHGHNTTNHRRRRILGCLPLFR